MFDRKKIREINAEIEKSFSVIEKNYGIKLELGNTRFSSTEFTTKVVAKVSSTGDAKMVEKEDFERKAPLIGLTASDYGRVISYAGKKFRITGIAPNRRKYPIIATNITNGKTYKLPYHSITGYRI